VSAPKTGASVPIHHVCTDKNCISTANGGPWTPRFKRFFDGAGLDIRTSLYNKIAVPGHKGQHPPEYHKYVYKLLDTETQGLSPSTPEYRRAVVNVLVRIKVEATTPGSKVNGWLIGG